MVLGSLDEDFLHSVLEKSPVVGGIPVTPDNDVFLA